MASKANLNDFFMVMMGLVFAGVDLENLCSYGRCSMLLNFPRKFERSNEIG